MTDKAIIGLIVNDKRYLSICKKIVKNKSHLAEDLYQELILNILETKDNRINLAYKEKRLEIYLYGIANNLWSRRTQIKKHGTHGTSVFFEHDYLNVLNYQIIDDNYNYERDNLENKLIEIIKKDCNSQEMGIRYKARVFNYSNNNIANLQDIKDNFKTPKEFSISSKIPYSAVWKACNEYKNTLKKKLIK